MILFFELRARVYMVFEKAGSACGVFARPVRPGGMRTLITAGGGSAVNTSDYVAASATPQGTFLVAYIPPDHSGSITVDMGAMGGPSRARWLDPTSGTYTSIGSGLVNSRTRAFTPPGSNSVGETDWTLGPGYRKESVSAVKSKDRRSEPAVE